MKTLIIYNLINYGEQFYIVPDEEIQPDWVPYLEEANGMTCNSDDFNEGMRFLCVATAPTNDECTPADVKILGEKYNCCLHKYKFELASDDKALIGPFSKVYFSSFLD